MTILFLYNLFLLMELIVVNIRRFDRKFSFSHPSAIFKGRDIAIVLYYYT